MNKKNRTVIILIVTVLIVLLVENITFRVLQNREDKRTKISIVLYDEGKNWDDVVSGAEQAASNGADITVVNMLQGSSADDQYLTIMSEIEAGADKVLATAIDSDRISELLGNDYASKVQFIVSGIDSKRYTTIAPDNYKMGYNLGILASQDRTDDFKVVIIDYKDTKLYKSERLSGTIDSLEEEGINYELWLEDSAQDIYGDVRHQLALNTYDAVLVLNEEILRDVINAINDSKSNVDAYAIAHSDEAVYYLDNRSIDALIYPDEFGVGYAAVTNILEPNAYVNQDFGRLISSKVVRRQDMYSGDYEKLLFPFVK